MVARWLVYHDARAQRRFPVSGYRTRPVRSMRSKRHPDQRRVRKCATGNACPFRKSYRTYGRAASPNMGMRHNGATIVGRLDARGHLSVMPSASALDCNTPHRQKEFAAGRLAEDDHLIVGTPSAQGQVFGTHRSASSLRTSRCVNSAAAAQTRLFRRERSFCSVTASVECNADRKPCMAVNCDPCFIWLTNNRLSQSSLTIRFQDRIDF